MCGRMEAQSRISVLIQTIANLSAEKLGTSMAHNTSNTCNNASVNNTSNSGTVTCTRWCMCECARVTPCFGDAGHHCFSQCSAVRTVLTPAGP